MSEPCVCDSSSSTFETQLVLLIVSLCFHVFQAFATGMKWRVKYKNCLCSVKPKGSSPSPDTDSNRSPERDPHVTVVVDETK
jgi:hypothetical protein